SRLLLDKPVIAAIEGYAVAGGLELALWCDLRVAADDATFGVFCRRWGVPLIDGGTVRLPRLIGLSRALDLILTGRAVNAQEALQMGLANRVVPDGAARAAADELARGIASFPQLCLRTARRSAHEQRSRRPPRLMSPRPTNEGGNNSRSPKISTSTSAYLPVAMLPSSTASPRLPSRRESASASRTSASRYRASRRSTGTSAMAR